MIRLSLVGIAMEKPPKRSMTAVWVALAGVGLATLNAWRLHEWRLAAVGVGLLALVGGAAIYVLWRDRRG